MRGFCLGIVLLSCLGLSWLGMQAVHEAGHVLHAFVSGGTVSRVVLYPFGLSRTDLDRNPRPLFVATGGVFWGAGLPAAALLLAGRLGPSLRQLVRFFGGFCLVANGTYLLGGTLVRAGDPSDLLRHGAPAWLLLVSGAALAGGGLAVWHRLGPRAGFDVHAGDEAWRIAGVLGLLLVLTIGLECLVFEP